MLELPDRLPPGALCDGADAALAHDLATTGVHWWTGAELTTDATGAVTGWPARMGARAAQPTAPNTGNALTGAAGDMTGLQCRDGLHCGFVIEDVTGAATKATLAARYLPPFGEDAKTVLTFNTGGAAKKTPGENYLFLSEAEGTITVKDDKGLVEATLPAPPADAPRLILASLAGDRLAVEIMGHDRSELQARAPVLTGPASLFIGCRNHRPGLTKTLGGALIGDVWLWPGRALLMPGDATDHAALTALRRFQLWTGDALWLSPPTASRAAISS
jgi:hypothetical protein